MVKSAKTSVVKNHHLYRRHKMCLNVFKGDVNHRNEVSGRLLIVIEVEETIRLKFRIKMADLRWRFQARILIRLFLTSASWTFEDLFFVQYFQLEFNFSL